MQNHTLTTGQLRKLTQAIGSGEDFPKLTDDPTVNHAIDCMMLGEESLYDEKIYAAEINLARVRGVTFPVA